MGKRFFLVWTSVILVNAFFISGTGISEQEEKDTWEPIRFLLGEWRGEGEGSKVRHTYKFVLQDKFIHSRTRAEFEPKEGEEKGEIHEDWGFFSHDSDRDKIIFRQFLSEGFVNTYVLNPIEPGDNRLIFNSESTEGAGGMLARLTIELLNENEYRMLLDLASPGKEFFNCQDISMHKVNQRHDIR